jgi:hypothetical protein
MSFQIKRGTNAQRLAITPLSGELIYTTDTGLLYVGDGTTPGGILVGDGTSGNIGGVSTFNGLTGGITLSAGSGISLVPNGNTITVNNTASSGLTKYVESFNGLTGNVTGVTTGVANIFGPLQSFTNGISASGACFSNNTIRISDITIGRKIDDSNIIFGKDPLSNSVSTFNTIFGRDGFKNAVVGLNTSIGYQNFIAASGITEELNGSNIAIGNFIGGSAKDVSSSVVIGEAIFFQLPANFSFQNNVCIGANIGGNVTANKKHDDNVIIGSNALGAHTGTAYSNVIIGSGTVSAAANDISDSIYIGKGIGSSIVKTKSSVVIGVLDAANPVGNNVANSIPFNIQENNQLLICSGLTSWIYGNSAGNILIGNPLVKGLPTERLHVDGNINAGGTYIRISNQKTPTPLESGPTGSIVWDGNFIYVNVTGNSWRRSTLSTF